MNKLHENIKLRAATQKKFDSELPRPDYLARGGG
jgi:hypothetical protein